VTKKLSTHQIAQYEDFDRRNITQSGCIWTLYSDGHVAAEWYTRWQGHRTGTRYVSDPGLIQVAALRADVPDQDPEAALTHLARRMREDLALQPGGELPRGWHQTRRGWEVY